MLNNKDTIVKYLRNLDLTAEEAVLYLELLDNGPQSHLGVSRKTDINRTKIYRIADDLEKRGLLTIQTDDKGTLLAATDPTNLEVGIVTREEHAKNQRAILKTLLPTLQDLRSDTLPSPDDFVVKTYEGVEGFKQMLWNELKAKPEVLIFGSGTIEDLVISKRWSEKHRERSVEAGYKVREIVNHGKKPTDFTKNQEFMDSVFKQRHIAEDVLNLEHQVIIYNDTVATYYWRGDQKVGYEVVNRANTNMMRQIFEHYWQLAS